MSWLLHVLVDVALAIGLVIGGLHGHGAGYLILDATGVYLILVTLFTDALGGVVRFIPRVVHRVLDAIVGVALIATPVVIWRTGTHVDPFATAMAVAVGVILVRDTWVTDHRVMLPARPVGLAGASGAGAPGAAGGAAAGKGSAIDVSAQVVSDGRQPGSAPSPGGDAPSNGPASPAADNVARRAGAATAKAADTARLAGQYAQSKGLNARQAGVAAGKAARYGRAAKAVWRKNQAAAGADADGGAAGDGPSDGPRPDGTTPQGDPGP